MLKLALPGGDPRPAVAEALAAAGLPSEEYADGSRSLRVAIDGHDEIHARVFREKDLPAQVATGAYDLAICTAPPLAEFSARHAAGAIVRLRPLALGETRLVLAAPHSVIDRLGPLREWPRWSGVRIATEYPWLAERLVRTLRLPRARVMALWGAAEAYPPEDAEACLLALSDDEALRRQGLSVLAELGGGSAWLIANRAALANRDLGAALGPLLALRPFVREAAPAESPRAGHFRRPEALPAGPRAWVRLALPDGHALRHTFAALEDAGLAFEGYGERSAHRRPRSGMSNVDIKVIRPQDMPGQVALGNFDLAVTGRDWLLDHQFAFPSTPVVEVADLHRSRYVLAAVVAEDLPARTIAQALAYWRTSGRQTIRVASEYPHLADHYARASHLGRYAVLPIAGASEGFVPEDAEILIEGTETGKSLIANRLKVLEPIALTPPTRSAALTMIANHLKVLEPVQVSTNCLIARADWSQSPGAPLINDLIERLRRVPAPA